MLERPFCEAAARSAVSPGRLAPSRGCDGGFPVCASLAAGATASVPPAPAPGSVPPGRAAPVRVPPTPLRGSGISHRTQYLPSGGFSAPHFKHVIIVVTIAVVPPSERADLIRCQIRPSLLLTGLARRVQSKRPEPMEVSLSAVIEAARLRRAGITAEVAGYLVLLAVEVAREAHHVAPDSLRLSEAGELTGSTASEAASETDVEAALRSLLRTLLALAQATAPALAAAAERAPRGDLAAFRAELAAALIPINHAAARRALARLYREARRACGAPISAEGGESSRGATPSPTPASALAMSPAHSASSPGGLEIAPLAEEHDGAPALEIDVVVELGDGREALAATAAQPGLVGPPSAGPEDGAPIETGLSAPAPTADADPVVGFRSDLSELISGFLAYTRSDEKMAAELRRMVGL